MQLAAVTTTTATPPASTAPSTGAAVMAALRPGSAPPAAASAPAAPAVPAASSGPVEEASFATKLFANVGQAQNRFVANQQVLGAVTQLLGARLAYIGSSVWSHLRGTD